jgi:hypothetical protein
MSFVRFIFDFLYVRDWHTGRKELSYSRLALAGGILILAIFATVSIMILQTPIEVSNPNLR